jgi:hypothetical protein
LEDLSPFQVPDASVPVPDVRFSGRFKWYIKPIEMQLSCGGGITYTET